MCCDPTVAHLQSLTLTFSGRDSHGVVAPLHAIAAGLAGSTKLEGLRLAATAAQLPEGAVCDVPPNTAALARQICTLPRLSRLHLSSNSLAAHVSGPLDERIGVLTALRTLDIEGATLTDAAALARGSAMLPMLPMLASLRFAGLHAGHSHADSRAAAAAGGPQVLQQLVAAVAAVPQLLQALLFEGHAHRQTAGTDSGPRLRTMQLHWCG